MKYWLKAMRLAAGLTQGDMACMLSVSQPYYCDIENGRRQSDMSYSLMEKLATALNVSVQEIIDAEKNRHEMSEGGNHDQKK